MHSHVHQILVQFYIGILKLEQVCEPTVGLRVDGVVVFPRFDNTAVADPWKA